MAEYWTEGLLERLTDAADPISKQLLAAATFYVVPRINPDGCFRGHLRYILWPYYCEQNTADWQHFLS